MGRRYRSDWMKDPASRLGSDVFESCHLSRGRLLPFGLGPGQRKIKGKPTDHIEGTPRRPVA